MILAKSVIMELTREGTRQRPRGAVRGRTCLRAPQSDDGSTPCGMLGASKRKEISPAAIKQFLAFFDAIAKSGRHWNNPTHESRRNKRLLKTLRLLNLILE